MNKFNTRVTNIGETIVYRESTCPFCGKKHITHTWLNVICPCGAKFYIHTHEWLNRKTGEKIKVEEEK